MPRRIRGPSTQSAEEAARESEADDLSFPPPYPEQSKFLLIAEKFLSTNGSRHNVVSIESSKHFKGTKKLKQAAQKNRAA